MHTRFPVLGVTFLAAMLAGASVSDANLILNGDFVTASAGGAAVAKELDVVSGTSTYLANWTSTGYNFLFLPGTNAAGGSLSPQFNNKLSLWSSSNGGIANTWNGQGPTPTSNFIASDPAYQTGPLQQTVAGLVVGRRYALSFQWAAGQQTGYTGPTYEGWQVSLGSRSLSTATVNNTSQGFVAWMMQTMTFTATATSSTLSFLSTGGPTGVPPFALLANVSMNMIPEPASALLWGGGAMGLLVARYRSRRAPNVMAAKSSVQSRPPAIRLSRASRPANHQRQSERPKE